MQVQGVRSITNTSGPLTSTLIDLEDRIIAKLRSHPSTVPIADWLKYEAAADFCLKSIARNLANGIAPERVLEALKGEARVMTMRAYGDLHPQMPLARSMNAQTYRDTLHADHMKQAA